jgi:hypothetical protein
MYIYIIGGVIEDRIVPNKLIINANTLLANTDTLLTRQVIEDRIVPAGYMMM